MLVQMLGVFAEFEREMIIDRVINGMERKASKGQWTVGFAPFGYRVDQATQHLVPVEEEAPTVEEIFDLYIPYVAAAPEPSPPTSTGAACVGAAAARGAARSSSTF
jgi:DNA invertase Pin-like site-specific DNA recombinase